MAKHLCRGKLIADVFMCISAACTPTFLPHGHTLLFMYFLTSLFRGWFRTPTFCWHTERACVLVRFRSAPCGTPLPGLGQASQMSQDVLMGTAPSIMKTRSRSWDGCKPQQGRIRERGGVYECGRRHLDISSKQMKTFFIEHWGRKIDFLGCVMKVFIFSN